jgi:hypothetical protein
MALWDRFGGPETKRSARPNALRVAWGGHIPLIEGDTKMGEPERADGDADELQERAEPEQPPVDGPSSGSQGEPGDRDLSGSSQGEPGGSGS